MPNSNPSPKPQNAARAAVHTLREIILSRPGGAFLGSEDELASLLGVGRATLRQTARLLEHEHLLKVKRGVGGGYYGHRPDSRAVTSAVATHLRIHTPSFLELVVAAGGLHAQLARLAAEAPPEADRRPIAAAAAMLREEDLSAGGLARAEMAVRDHLYELARNPFIELILRVHTEICFREIHKPVFNSPERLRAFRKNRLSLVAAVIDGDAEVAVVHARRANAMVESWARDLQDDPLRRDDSSRFDLLIAP